MNTRYSNDPRVMRDAMGPLYPIANPNDGALIDLRKRVDFLENQVAALTMLVREMRAEDAAGTTHE